MGELDKFYRLFVIRHGETEWNKEFRIQGFKDSPLTENGIKQTELLSKYLKFKYFNQNNKSFNINYAYSSDLGRAIQTTEILKKSLNFNYEKRSELREKNFGIFEGLTLNEIIEKYPEYKDDFFQKVHSYNFKIPNGESNKDLMERVIGFIYLVFDQVNNNENVLFITHGGVVESIFKYIFDIKEMNLRKYSLNNCSINIFEVRRDFIKLLVWGELPYSIENDIKLK